MYNCSAYIFSGYNNLSTIESRKWIVILTIFRHSNDQIISVMIQGKQVLRRIWQLLEIVLLLLAVVTQFLHTHLLNNNCSVENVTEFR